MSRIYAGILGPLAMAATLVDGISHARAAESVLLVAWWTLLVFAVIGYIVGWTAERIVDDAVTSQIADELDAETTQPVGSIEPEP